MLVQAYQEATFQQGAAYEVCGRDKASPRRRASSSNMNGSWYSLQNILARRQTCGVAGTRSLTEVTLTKINVQMTTVLLSAPPLSDAHFADDKNNITSAQF